MGKFYSEVGDYWRDLLDDDDFQSLYQGLQTANPGVLAQIDALKTATHLDDLTATPSALTQLPSPYQTYFLSVYSKEQDIASKNGILSNGQLVGAPKPTAPPAPVTSQLVVTVTSAAAGFTPGVTGGAGVGTTVFTSVVTHASSPTSASAAAAAQGS